MTSTETEGFIEYRYPADYIPVRGDTVSYWDTNMRMGVVITSQDNTITLLTIDNEVKSFGADSVKVVNDTRMKLLAMLNEEDAAESRERFLTEYIQSIKERLAKEAIAKGGTVDENGDVIVPGGRGSRMDEDKARTVHALSKAVLEALSASYEPMTKADIVKAVPMESSLWSSVIKRACEDPQVIVKGKGKGKTFAAAGRIVTKTNAPTPSAAPKNDLHSQIIDFVISNGPVGKSDIMEFYPDEDWNTIRKALEDSPKVVITGQRRGTKYQGKV